MSIPFFPFGIPVLLYHRIEKAGPTLHRDLFVSPRHFEGQIAWLAKNRYHFVSTEELGLFLGGKTTVPDKSIIITFDDGTADNYTNAFPVLQKYGARAIIFLIADCIGRDITWHGEPARFLSESHVKKMALGGIEFGSHTLSHPSLTKVTPERLLAEVRDSKTILEQRLGLPIRTLCYPFGSYNADVEKMANDAGYIAGFTLHRGINTSHTIPTRLRRIKPDESLLTFVLSIAAAGVFELARTLYRRKG